MWPAHHIDCMQWICLELLPLLVEGANRAKRQESIIYRWAPGPPQSL